MRQLRDKDRSWLRRKRRRGKRGLRGIDGPTGPNGLRGNDPTEEDIEPVVFSWLTSHSIELKGEKGDKGDPGRDGTNGTNGINGTNGSPGSPGSPGPDRMKFAKTLTTNASGLWTGTIPATATVLYVSSRTFGAIVQSMTQSGTTVTIQFAKLQTGGLGLTLGTLLSATILAPSVGTISFDLIAVEPTT